MSGISKDTLNRARDVPLTDIVRHYIGSESRQSGNRVVLLCPFHQEKTPSFSIDMSKNLYHCFGCGIGGDSISFVSEYNNLGFSEAIREICETFGIEFQADYSETRRFQKRADLFEVNQQAAVFFQKNLKKNNPEANNALDYLHSRLSDEQIKKWQIGYAPETWQDFKSTPGSMYNPELLSQAGIIRKSERGTYPAFSDRIMIPIFDQNNKIVGFGARTLKDDDQEPKYINSSDSPIYKKSEVLYGINTAIKAIRKTREAVVVEGYFDLIAAQQHGIENCVSPAGTALTEGHLRFLSSIAKKLFIWYDADKGGWESAQRTGKKALDLGIPLYFINIRGGDPDEILKRPEGHEIFLRERAANKSLVEFALEINGLRDIKNPDEQYAIIKRELFGMISASKSPLQKVLWLKAINEELGLKAPILFKEYQHHVRTIEKTPAEKPKERDVEDFVLGFLAANPAYRRMARQRFAAEDFSTNEKGLFFDFLCSESTSQGLSIKPDLQLNSNHGPLFLNSNRVNLVREFEQYYQDRNPNSGEMESTRVLHEDQLSRLESLLRETSQADKGVLEKMEAKLLVAELKYLDEEITRLSKNQTPEWAVHSEELIHSYEKKLDKYNWLVAQISNNSAR